MIGIESIAIWIVNITGLIVITYAVVKTFRSMNKHSNKLEELEASYNISKGREK